MNVCKLEKIVWQYLIWLELPILAFRGFCKTVTLFFLDEDQQTQAFVQSSAAMDDTVEELEDNDQTQAIDKGFFLIKLVGYVREAFKHKLGLLVAGV